ncbi:hypothetical protein FQZ97_730640 [compost metagenome]
MAAETTIISISVRVPVLSEQIRDTEPRVSTAGRRRMMALRLAMRWTPMARVMVISAGRPSGIIDTAMPTIAWNSSTKAMPITQRP